MSSTVSSTDRVSSETLENYLETEVRVDWVDAQALSPWVAPHEISAIVRTDVRSLGTLIRVTDEFIVLAQSVATENGEDPCYGNVLVIPRGMIFDIDTL